MNKKILLIIIAAVACLSIVVLGIVAPQISQTYITVKVTGVVIDKEDCVTVGENENQNQIIRLEGDNKTYQIKWVVKPLDENDESIATNKNVSFDSSNKEVTVSKTGLVTFPENINKTISTIITITTEDGSFTDEITVMYKYENVIIVD